MKRILFMILVPLLMLSLWGCDASLPQTQIQVSITEVDGCRVESNGIWITPGENAVFLLDLEYGYSLAQTDYSGTYRAVRNGAYLELTLENVQYPTRVNLELTTQYCFLTYHPNGGIGADTAVTCDLSRHSRPNTSIGTDMFRREGYTLVGWNTEPDGSGVRIGLGSRFSTSGGKLTLYAQWAKWTDENCFDYTAEDTVTITGYSGADPTLVIPETIDGKPVTTIAAGAFVGCEFTSVILPKTMEQVDEGAFQNCRIQTVTLYDNIVSIRDSSFLDCPDLQTLHINAIESPSGSQTLKESCYADKVDLLINAQGKEKLVFYGGCSTWYNLDGRQVSKALGDHYVIINLGLNGTVNSAVQMQVMGAYLEENDILFHTPEISSKQQLLITQSMDEFDTKLWGGLEYNYDLFAHVDLRTVPGAFDSLCHYLSTKKGRTTYQQCYTDDAGRPYCDDLGCIPFYRADTAGKLVDKVLLDPAFIDDSAMDSLQKYYDWYQVKGVQIYVSYACVNMDAVPEEQQKNVLLMDSLFRQAIEAMNGPVLISRLENYLYHNEDFYDTNYHLLSEAANHNTSLWLQDLLVQMRADGLLGNDASE